MNIKIVSDSSCDLKQVDGAIFESAPLKIITTEREYVDNADLDVIGMLADLKAYKGKSHSSCPNSAEYLAAFGDAENVFCVTITSGLSGSYNAANAAAKEYMSEHPERHVHVIDSLSAGAENALLVEKLCALVSEGKNFEEVKAEITEYHNHTRLVFALESMHNLVNNGRVSPIAAKVAGLLGIRAVGKASDVGTLEMTGKSRGPMATANDLLSNMIGDGYKGGRVRIHHANNPASADLLKTKILEKFPEADIVVAMTGGLCSFYAEEGGLMIGFEI